MEVVVEVCDICGKKHGMMLNQEGIVFGDRLCFLEFCKSVWLEWERDYYRSRGVLKSSLGNIESKLISKNIRASIQETDTGHIFLLKKK